MKAVEFKKVSFIYPNSKNKILDCTNFFINYGEITLLTGFSGSGKSTVFNLINGIIPNSIPGKISGEILVNEQNIKNKKISDIAKYVGSVLQNADNQILKEFVEDEIAFGCENFAFSEEKIKEKIDAMTQTFKLNKKSRTDQLSGGQKQMLITATTLAMEQKILILDEPLANLDKDGSTVLMKILQALSKKGYAVLIVEHRIDAVLPFVDTIFEISDKKVNKIDNYCEYLKNKANKIQNISTIKPTDENIISVKNLSYSYKKDKVLNDITFDIKKGERVVLLGENGSGKTTLVKIIAKLIKSKNKNIQVNIDGRKNYHFATRKWFKKVGFIFQNPNYQLFMPSVLEEIKYGVDKNDNQIDKIIKMFDLQNILDRHPQSLSEGQKRKVSIAAIMASNRNILILDEPTVGQDYEGLKKLCDNINQIHDETMNTIITITHDFRCAEAICDKAIVIKSGTICKIGGKELIREYFSDRYCADELNAD